MVKTKKKTMMTIKTLLTEYFRGTMITSKNTKTMTRMIGEMTRKEKKRKVVNMKNVERNGRKKNPKRMNP